MSGQLQPGDVVLDGRPGDVILQDEPQRPAPSPESSRPMTLEEAEAAEAKASANVRAADGELVEARETLAIARAALSEAAGRGFEAAREAQRAITAAEARFEAARTLHELMLRVQAPIAQRRSQLYRERRRETLIKDFGERLVERGRIDSEIVAAVNGLAAMIARRDAVTSALASMKEEAERSAFGAIGGPADDEYRTPEFRKALTALPAPFLRLAVFG
jgi:hypothetical protein